MIMTNYRGLWFSMCLLLVASLACGQTPTYTFDDGQVPAETSFPTSADTAGNAHNAGSGAASAGGFNNSGMLTMTTPQSGVQTFAQWLLPDFASGQAITNLTLSFNLFMGRGRGNGATGRVPPPGGDGMG